MKLNRNYILVGVIIVLVAIASFFAGRRFQILYPGSRVAQFNMGAPRNGMRAGMGRFAPRTRNTNQAPRSFSGNIVAVNTNQISLQYPNGVTINVNLSSTTTYTKLGVTAKQSDLSIGQTIIVSGMVNMDGSLTAQSIQITK